MGRMQNIGKVIVTYKKDDKQITIENVSEWHFDAATEAFAKTRGFTVVTMSETKHAFRSIDVDHLTFESTSR